MIDQAILDALKAPLDFKNVKKPSGSFGPKGDYIEGWHAINEANRIFGFDGWSYQVLTLAPCHEPYENAKGNMVVGFICTIEVTALGVTRQDVGYGSGASKQIGDAYESASKEAVTDALKRALRTFGNQFGLALYDKTRENVTDGTAPKSSAALKREDAWPEFERDLAECRSFVSLDVVKNKWRSKVVADGWSKSWINAMPDAFSQAEKSIEEMMEKVDA